MALPNVGRTPRIKATTGSFATLLAFFFAGALIFGRLGALPLLDPDEGRNAEVVREMAEAGRWLVPTYNGLPYLDKPALYFRLVALSLTFLGDTEFAARLPSPCLRSPFSCWSIVLAAASTVRERPR